MIPVRCPKCNKLVGFFDGRGEMECPRCRKHNIVHFDTAVGKVELRCKSV